MKKTLLLALLPLLYACTEDIDIQSRSDYHEYLSVQAVLTDQPDRPQQVVLSRSISYFQNETQPMVKGASVKVNDTVFSETADGVYVAPLGFCCKADETYHLSIGLPDGEEYSAEARMPESGFEMEGIDYAWAGGKTMDNDSLWTIGLWGIKNELESYYMVIHAVNGLYEPFENVLVSDDTFFSSREIAAFPIEPLYQTAENRKQYGDCYKYLEEGDVITLEIWTLDRGFEKYLGAMTTSEVSVPLFSPQPANTPTNIFGDLVMGYFAVCSVASASVVVDDPLRPYYKRAVPPL